MPEIDDADGSQPHLKGDKKMPKVPKEKVKEACNHTGKGDECPVHGTKDCATVKEEAPKGKKYARMVKHIKKNYPKDKEGIAYATAWKHKNKKESFEGGVQKARRDYRSGSLMTFKQFMSKLTDILDEWEK